MIMEIDIKSKKKLFVYFLLLKYILKKLKVPKFYGYWV